MFCTFLLKTTNNFHKKSINIKHQTVQQEISSMAWKILNQYLRCKYVNNLGFIWTVISHIHMK